ncbi:hypothetical protein ACEZCY_16950 [Streptacidiphilus sp. N1-12]|uniref:Uncharacterized protein n=2 Tax=Streptacidiphilus alkalitolerans TaxID=3342712 RepID=A0ABV6WFU0_9ACTN
MPRGRHRQSSPLSRLLPPTACGVLAIASLIAAVFTGDPAVLRTLVVAASVGAFAGAVLLRLREHAGDVELEAEIAARSRDESRFEDRVAELEYQAETAEEQVKRLERRLLAQRAQITRIESENARLLRERARAAAEEIAREAEQARLREVTARGTRPTPTAYLKAAAALRGLERRAAVGQAQRIAANAATVTPRSVTPQAAAPQAEGQQGAAPQAEGQQGAAPQAGASRETAPQAAALQIGAQQSGSPQAEGQQADAAQAVGQQAAAPQSGAPQAGGPQGVGSLAGAPQETAPQGVGQQAVAAQGSAGQQAGAPQGEEQQAVAARGVGQQAGAPQAGGPQGAGAQVGVHQAAPQAVVGGEAAAVSAAPLPSALDALAARQHPVQERPATPASATPQGPAWARAALPPMRPASAVLPTALTRPSRQSRDLLRKDAGSSGTFNFFSRQEAAISTGLGDLADVVGDEAAAAQSRYAGEAPAAEPTPGAGTLPDPVHDREAQAEAELVDLTADDETEPIDVRALRAI